MESRAVSRPNSAHISNHSQAQLSQTQRTIRPSSSKSMSGDKSKSVPFFQSTRVESCSKVIEHKGQCIAVPFKILNSKGRPLSAYKYTNHKQKELKSVYALDFSKKIIPHTGMAKKPLVPYHPESFRNRLPTGNFYAQHKNLSKIQIGSQVDVNFKQWVSTAKDNYQWPTKVPITNLGILSDISKRSHTKLTAHN